MNILLVNNNTRHLEKLTQALKGHNVEMQMYEPGIEFHTAGKDLVVLSGGGGEGKEMYDKHLPTHKLWYENEMSFVLRTDTPLIGICMGFEVVAGAYGSPIAEMPQKDVEKYEQIQTTFKGWLRVKKKRLWQFEAHDYCVPSVSTKQFDILADSDTGIEMIRHKKRPILATQFHPEFPRGSLHLASMINAVAY